MLAYHSQFPLFNIPITCIFKFKYIIVWILLHIHCVLSQNCILHLTVERVNNNKLRNDNALFTLQEIVRYSAGMKQILAIKLTCTHPRNMLCRQKKNVPVLIYEYDINKNCNLHLYKEKSQLQDVHFVTLSM